MTNVDQKAAVKIYSINQQFFKPQGPKKKRLWDKNRSRGSESQRKKVICHHCPVFLRVCVCALLIQPPAKLQRRCISVSHCAGRRCFEFKSGRKPKKFSVCALGWCNRKNEWREDFRWPPEEAVISWKERKRKKRCGCSNSPASHYQMEYLSLVWIQTNKETAPLVENPPTFAPQLHKKNMKEWNWGLFTDNFPTLV